MANGTTVTFVYRVVGWTNATEPLVWIDCEMTGLDLARDALIEVAVVVTDGDLVPLDDGLDVIIAADEQVLDGMIPLVRDMHASSGLTMPCASRQ